MGRRVGGPRRPGPPAGRGRHATRGREFDTFVGGTEVVSVSIVRIGMGEKKGYGEGYDAIFKKKGAKKPAPPAAAKKPAKKKPAKKK